MSKKESATISKSEAAFRAEDYESISQALYKLGTDRLYYMEFMVNRLCESDEHNFYIVYHFVRRLCA